MPNATSSSQDLYKIMRKNEQGVTQTLVLTDSEGNPFISNDEVINVIEQKQLFATEQDIKTILQ